MPGIEILLGGVGLVLAMTAFVVVGIIAWLWFDNTAAPRLRRFRNWLFAPYYRFRDWLAQFDWEFIGCYWTFATVASLAAWGIALLFYGEQRIEPLIFGGLIFVAFVVGFIYAALNSGQGAPKHK
jgi:hypothetical protein